MPAAPAACAHLVLTVAAGRTAGSFRVAAGMPGRERHQTTLRPSPDTLFLSPRRPSPTGGAYVESV
jgi:hypothetical protein